MNAPSGWAAAVPPAVLAGLGNLELVAKAAVEGLLHGAHRSTRPGFSQEFAEYRDYAPGDDLRFVDWNAYARTDRLFLKRFEGETNTRLLVLVDVSASMDVGAASGLGLSTRTEFAQQTPTRPPRRAVPKLRYAGWLAAALVYLAGRAHDAAGLLTFADDVREFLPPASGGIQQQALFHRLAAMTAAGGSDWQSAFGFAARRVAKRGILAAISDFYCPPAAFGRALRTLGARGHDVLAFHLRDPAERKPRLRTGRNTTLRDAESGAVMEVDAAEMRSGYPRRLQAHADALRREAAAAGADYVCMDTDAPLAPALAWYLRFRARRP